MRFMVWNHVDETWKKLSPVFLTSHGYGIVQSEMMELN